MIRILIVEDELPIANLIRLSLSKAGYTCDCVYNGGAAADQIAAQSYDLILLDVMLPEVDGFTLLEYIRPYEIPVIFLTAKNAVQDRVKGLRLGAEDYIVKPFEVLELLARVDVVLRRYHKNDQPMTIAGLEIDPRSMQVRRDEVEIPLTRKEYSLLGTPTSPCTERLSTGGCGAASSTLRARPWIFTSSACGRRWAGKDICAPSPR